ncbi:hypothetical protein [Polycyclovorans algicola]|uniref:hypothetical protein n=1 Tax=Polycyclovorans algicola TaxID=616992 RepID=UPI0004A6BE70|nr:hypothetical protein [Polycyclovorans algicola]
MNIKKMRTAGTLKSVLVAGLVMFGASGAVNAGLLSNLVEGTVTLLDSLTGGIPSSSINESVSLSAGPVPIPDVPVTVCVGGQCVSTPALSSVALELVASVQADAALPVIVAGSCPQGQTGVALSVVTSSASTVLETNLSGQLGMMQLERMIGPFDLGAEGRTVTVTACAD